MEFSVEEAHSAQNVLFMKPQELNILNNLKSFSFEFIEDDG